MNRKKLFLILVIVLNLVPLAAFGKPAVKSRGKDAKQVTTLQAEDPARTIYENSMTFTEAEDTFFSFHAEKFGNDPASKVVLRGLLFKECNPDNSLKINTWKSPDGSTVAFEINDAGGVVRECMKRLQSRGNCDTRECVSLASLSSTIDLATQVDKGKLTPVKIQFARLPANGDGIKSIEFTDFRTPLTFVTAAKLRADAEEGARLMRDRRMDRARNEFASCRDSLANLPLARNALTTLVRAGEISRDQAELERKRLDQREFQLIEQRVAKAKPEELEDIRAELSQWASEHPGNDSKIAALYHRIALAYVKQRNAGTSAYDNAAATIREAQELDGISGADNARLLGYQRDISIGRVQQIASQGSANNFMLYPSYATLMQQVQIDAHEACNGENANLEGCSSAMTAVRTVASIPTAAQAVDQRRMQMQLQMQQAMAQSMSGTGMNQMPLNAWSSAPQTPASGFYR